MFSLFQRKRVPPSTPCIERSKGLTRPQPAASLLATPRRKKLLEHIWQRTSLSRKQFATLYLAPDELYAGQLVATLDWQHPRDLFDVWQLFESGGISDGMVECFVVYLAGHNRSIHEVLFGNDKDIAGEYARAFVGMAEVDCPLQP